MMNEEIKSQILQIRDTGLANMLDINMVQSLAYEMDMYALVNFIEERRDEYVQYIMTGTSPEIS